jgi:serine/threonine protein kinase
VLQALLVIELCEHGTLLGYVSEPDTQIDTSMLLTFCHDVGDQCQSRMQSRCIVDSFQRPLANVPYASVVLLLQIGSGMHYLSSRRIVHRDVAARNVSFTSPNIAISTRLSRIHSWVERLGCFVTVSRLSERFLNCAPSRPGAGATRQRNDVQGQCSRLLRACALVFTHSCVITQHGFTHAICPRPLLVFFQVSDFGMSTALAADTEGDYASNYVRMEGELPVRWAAIEVLAQGKYSKASDV